MKVNIKTDFINVNLLSEIVQQAMNTMLLGKSSKFDKELMVNVYLDLLDDIELSIRGKKIRTLN